MNIIPPRGTPAGKRWLALVAAVVLVLVSAVQVVALAGTDFEAGDGNLVTAAGTDWEDAPNRSIGPDPFTGDNDNAFGQGTHEDSPVPTVVNDSIPPNKSDLTRFYVAHESLDDDFLYLAWERVQDPTGTTNMDFEFNQSETVSSNGVTPVRTEGDLLIMYDIDHGGTVVTMAYRLWDGEQWGPANSLDGFAEASFNAAEVTDPISGQTLSPRTFGEAAINLTDSGLFPADKCVNFGSAYLKSRASDSFNSEIKDFVAPTPVNVSNCGKIIIRKDAVPDDATDFEFTATPAPDSVAGNGHVDFKLDDDNDNTLDDTKTFGNVFPGEYAVNEDLGDLASAWELTDIDCEASEGSSWVEDGATVTIDLAANGLVDCTFTNTRKPANLIVIKHVVNDNGGDAVAGDFTMNVTGTNVSDDSFPGDEDGTKLTLDPGDYEVTEEIVDGYVDDYSADCSGTIAAGETKTCTVTNDDAAAKLIVIKHVINDNGGALAADDFTMRVGGGNPASFPGDEDGTEVLVDAGSYAVTEDTVAGYIGTYSADCSGIIKIGETKTCTVTNNDAPPGLTVVKHVINDNGGTAVAGDFTIKVDGTAVNPGTFAGSEAGTKVALHAGAYKVTEEAVKGYAGTYSADCSGTVALGETKVCTIVNDDVAPVLTVVKHVVNDEGGIKTADQFTMKVTGTDVAPSEFPGSEAGTKVALNAGAYSVDEVADDGYAKTLSADCAGSIAVGEEKTCTITNDDIVEVLPLILPRTGMDLAGSLALGLGLLLAGGVLLLVNRRRAHGTA